MLIFGTLGLSRFTPRPRVALVALTAALGFTAAHGFAQTGAPGQKPPQQPTGTSQPPPSQPGRPATQPPPTGTTGPSKPTTPSPSTPSKPGGIQVTPLQGQAPPADYVIGPDDALEIVYWREKDLSAAVVVRPDGKIALPLLNDVQAAGLTPDQLRERVQQAASRFVTDPTVTIVVKAINSRRVFVTGMVNRPGPYPLNDTMTVLQMLALAGGLHEFAKDKEILIMRTEKGQTTSYKFNYRDVRKGKNLQQNITLKPGDTIVVP